MSFLRSGSKLFQHLRNQKQLPFINTQPTRCASGLIPPGYEQYHLKEEDHVQPLDNTEPLTPEKRAELAAKYNLRPEDYVPMNTPDFNVGDYPMLPLESALERDPFYDWDCMIYRRNYGEPILWEQEMYGPVGLDTTPTTFDRGQMWKLWLGYLAGFFVLWALGHRFKSFLPRAPKQYPEYYPGDELKTNYYEDFDWFLERGLNPKLRERKQIINYTFTSHPWDPEAH